MNRVLLACISTLSLTSAVSAQVNFPEAEPNSGKSEATPAVGMVTGDFLSGVSIGNVTTLGDPSLNTADYFRVELPIGLIGIYCYELRKTSVTLGHELSIRGVNQVGGIPGVIDVPAQLVTPATTPTDKNVWYGYCKGDRHYQRTDGAPTTPAPYQDEIICTPVPSVPVAGTFQAGPITITTVGQGHSTDTEIYLFDINMNPVAGGHSDDLIVPASTQSQVTVLLPPGTYILAVSDFNTCNNLSDNNPNEASLNGNLLDFADLIVNSSTATNVNVSFAVSDGTTTTPVVATKARAFEIYWASFVVASPAAPFCFGDGSGTPCPCGNNGAVGNGCANSVNPSGANLTSSGVSSLGADSFTLLGSGMPNGSALYFQGTVQLTGRVFGDGLRCAGGTTARLGTKTNVAGASQYPGGGDPSISLIGFVGAPGTRTYQCWYRNAGIFCTPALFNLTNGLQATWTL